MAALNAMQAGWGDNPYVGPRTFTTAEAHKFYGREKEARQFIAMIVSNREVLFYAPSGAGKSSLLFAKVIPDLTAEGFEVLPVGRVSGDSGMEITADNIFAYNLMTSLHQDEHNTAGFLGVKLAYFLDNLVNKSGTFVFDDQYLYPIDAELRPRVLIIDQFEEILTTNSAFWSQREDFFRQLGEALAYDNQLWVVLAMREDFIAGLDPYVANLPDQLRSHFYMQYLDQRAALEAIQKPAAAAGRPFAPGAAEILVRNLRQIRGEGAIEEEHLAEFVEPVQLQAVCYQMWEKLKQRPGPTITAGDVADFADVDTALTNFYEATIVATVAETGAAEIDLRNWFEYKLITEAGTRNMVFRGEEETGGLATTVADCIKSKFIVREVVRPGGIWFELVHDRFVQPVLDANREWRLDQPLIRLAQDWDESGRPESRLLQGGQLEYLLGSNWQALGPLVAAYVAASQEVRQRQEEALAAAEDAARERELAQQRALASEQEARAEEAEASKKRLSLWVRLAIVAGVIATLFALWAGYQTIRAQTNATMAREGEQFALQAQQTAEAEAERADANFAVAATNAAVAGEALLALQAQILDAPVGTTPTPSVGSGTATRPIQTDTNPTSEGNALTINQEALANPTSQYEALQLVQETATAVAGSIKDLGPQRGKIGESVTGQPIYAVRFGDGPRTLLFVGGIHYGNSPSSVDLAQTAIKWLAENPDAVPTELSIFIVPNMNPDGNEALGGLAARYNANKVDLNRNWDCNWRSDPIIQNERRAGAGGTKPFSEPETAALATFIRRVEPEAVIFWDAADPDGLAAAGGCPDVSAEAQELAKVYSGASGYRLSQAATSDFEGDASDFLVSQGIASFFVVLPRDDSPDWDANLKAIQALIAQIAG